MNRKKIWIAAAIVIALGLGCLLFRRMIPAEYVPAKDEIALHIQLDTKEDVGLLVFDYRADDREYSGGVSNADRSFIKRDSDNILVWNRQELGCDADAVELFIQFRIILEYVAPNFENVYPEEITQSIDPVSWKARFGESYFIAITGDRLNGYQAALNVR